MSPCLAQLPPPPRLTPDEIEARERQAGDDPVPVLQLVPLAEEQTAKRLREKVNQLLQARRREAPPAELNVLAARLAEALPATLRSPAEVRETLGQPKHINRQVLFNRYLEQWVYEAPLPLCVVFDCRKGQEPSLQTVQPLRRRQL